MVLLLSSLTFSSRFDTIGRKNNSCTSFSTRPCLEAFRRHGISSPREIFASLARDQSPNLRSDHVGSTQSLEAQFNENEEIRHLRAENLQLKAGHLDDLTMIAQLQKENSSLRRVVTNLKHTSHRFLVRSCPRNDPNFMAIFADIGSMSYDQPHDDIPVASSSTGIHHMAQAEVPQPMHTEVFFNSSVEEGVTVRSNIPLRVTSQTYT